MDGNLPHKEHYLLKFFSSSNLPEKLEEVSAKFRDLAFTIDASFPDDQDKTTALQKLLDAKNFVSVGIFMNIKS